jgi:hypothetical protein
LQGSDEGPTAELRSTAHALQGSDEGPVNEELQLHGTEDKNFHVFILISFLPVNI